MRQSVGGGIYSDNRSNPSLINVTFSNNTAPAGGAIFNGSDSTSTIKNSIFWGNSATFGNTETGTFLIDYSLVQGGCPMGATCNGSILTVDPLLGPLAYNGGFIQTMALNMGSPAIDTGNDATCAATDQRGVTRPQGAHCDMGAYEYIDPATFTNRIYLPLVMR